MRVSHDDIDAVPVTMHLTLVWGPEIAVAPIGSRHIHGLGETIEPTLVPRTRSWLRSTNADLTCRTLRPECAGPRPSTWNAHDRGDALGDPEGNDADAVDHLRLTPIVPELAARLCALRCDSSSIERSRG